LALRLAFLFSFLDTAMAGKALAQMPGGFQQLDYQLILV
jgi:hypothetical protein